MMKKALLIAALAMTPWLGAAALASTSTGAPCDPSCPTCQNAINTFQEQAQETLAVATPPNPQNQVNNDTCLGNALNFSLSTMFPSSMSGLIQQLEKLIFQTVCSAASSVISNTVSRGNSLLNFNLPANQFTQLTGMGNFTPINIANNGSGGPGVTFQNSGGNIWNGVVGNAANNTAGQASSQVNIWYNNILP
jgi:hypothetical protein